MPIWTCANCGLPWPCANRRLELRAEFADAPVSLALYLSAHLVLAMQDMTWVHAGTLHHRFVGWAREQPAPDNRAGRRDGGRHGGASA